jgi:hypothetical protein
LYDNCQLRPYPPDRRLISTIDIGLEIEAAFVARNTRALSKHQLAEVRDRS